MGNYIVTQPLSEYPEQRQKTEVRTTKNYIK